MGIAKRLLGVTFFLGAAGLVSLPAPAVADPACIPAAKCCRICDAGQACGNTCISRAKACHKGRGCACDRAEVCSAP